MRSPSPDEEEWLEHSETAVLTTVRVFIHHSKLQNESLHRACDCIAATCIVEREVNIKRKVD